MIKIINKQDCNGCCACKDICPLKAITLVTDFEGFWYPEVNENLCTNCGLCNKTCPEINADVINKTNSGESSNFATHHKNQEIRLDSTSGGVFSALANKVYDIGGYVAGAIYNDDFSVRHIVSNKREDLLKIRSSKYLQSKCENLYQEIKELLINGEFVLVCGCPCQMAALRLYLAKDYEKLLICDFICRGINSPKIFRKHLDSLERKYGSKVVYAKAKNKEFGWRALTFKATFENGESYYGDGNCDNFTRGYLQSGSYCRPSCYSCNFKNLPRIADITLADFWGIEKIDPTLDNNTGTSLIMCNSKKGFNFFESIQQDIVYRSVNIEDIKPGNQCLLDSLPPPFINRDAFFNDVDKKSFDIVAKKYFPIRRKNISKIIIVLKKAIKPFYTIGFHPKVWCQFIWINFLRKNTLCNFRKGHYLLPTPNCVFDIHNDAKIIVKGNILIGFSNVKGSKLETRIRLEKNTEFHINDCFTMCADADVQVFEGGKLILEGGFGSGCNIHCQIVAKSKITIGRSTLIGRNVIIRDYDAHYIKIKGYKVSKPIMIGEHCWIGDGAMIAKGVKIGDGAIVAARSWVISKVLPKSLVGGTPAVLIEDNIEWQI